MHSQFSHLHFRMFGWILPSTLLTHSTVFTAQLSSVFISHAFLRFHQAVILEIEKEVAKNPSFGKVWEDYRKDKVNCVLYTLYSHLLLSSSVSLFHSLLLSFTPSCFFPLTPLTPLLLCFFYTSLIVSSFTLHWLLTVLQKALTVKNKGNEALTQVLLNLSIHLSQSFQTFNEFFPLTHFP